MTRPNVPAPRAAILILALVASAALAACGGSATGSAGAGSPAVAAPGGAVGQSLAALPTEVSTADASALRDAGALVLDVREPDEWAAGHIPGATHIPLGDLEARAGELPKDRNIVVVCRSGNRSAQGRDILLGAGFPAVTSMAGGMNDWVAAGYPTTTG
jgi:rhodanese-related sulfurtransferase